MSKIDLVRVDPTQPQERIIDVVYASLREAIFSGQLKPDMKLSVPELARQLGVSRSPVREAVVRLTRDQLAREESRRGAVVARVGLETLVRLYEVREVLEGLACRLAATRGRPNMLARLAETLDAHGEAIENQRFDEHTRLDMLFHRIIRENTDNPGLTDSLDALQAQVRLGMLTTTVTAGPDRALADHRAIYEALRLGDAARAETYGRMHIARLRVSLASVAAD